MGKRDSKRARAGRKTQHDFQEVTAVVPNNGTFVGGSPAAGEAGDWGAVPQVEITDDDTVKVSL